MSWFRSLESRQTRKAPASCFPGVAVEFTLSIGSLTLTMTPRSSILFNSFSSLSLSATGILRLAWITATASGFSFAWRSLASGHCLVSKKVGGLPFLSVQQDSPGNALTVGGWIRPGDEN